MTLDMLTSLMAWAEDKSAPGSTDGDVSND